MVGELLRTFLNLRLSGHYNKIKKILVNCQVTNNSTIYENLLPPSQLAENVACVVMDDLVSRGIDLAMWCEPNALQTHPPIMVIDYKNNIIYIFTLMHFHYHNKFFVTKQNSPSCCFY